MPKRLIVMRHAKSSWNHPGLEDHDRPLNERGRQSAQALGVWLRAQGYVPDAILSSTATRTRESAAMLGFDDVPATFTHDLYLADAGDMIATLRKAEGDCVLLLGHNPGIAWLAELLVTRPPAHGRFADYPTGATLVADFGIDAWAELEPETGKVVNFTVPRDLLG
ncbi:histidine phosphatase family protein [Roseovarius nubinhibens]|uniref:SixA phosphatase family protein n=1 Tax=Roseovarius nubinhibens TaxID=314263 RepID=UPI001C09B9F8|nr:histidine phosphatase family protein [Roseovarius nubinhibens]MBU2999011.1 histidine phosphatase family protein [Roseovarius nubinhibens]